MKQDKTLTCRDCKNQFVFTASEQAFFAEKGFTNEPSRCPKCRAAKKQRNGRTSRPSSRSKGKMYTATCASCGKEAQIPFKPSGERPIYCKECFSTKRSRD